MQKIVEMIPTIISIVCFVLSVVLFIAKYIALKKKASATTENEKQEAEKMICLIDQIIPSAVEFAENSGMQGGKLKKMLAVTQIMNKCLGLGIDYEANANLIDEKIEELIRFTKEVNSNNKPEEVKEELVPDEDFKCPRCLKDNVVKNPDTGLFICNDCGLQWK